MMNKRIDSDAYQQISEFQNLILAGYREAAANGHTDISLELSFFNFVEHNTDLYRLWLNNASNVISLKVLFDTNVYKNKRIPASSHMKFDLSSCHKLKTLDLSGNFTFLNDSGSSVISELAISIVLNNADSHQCTYPPPVLPSIERISIGNVTCPSSWLRSLFSILLTLDHQVVCELDCKIISCEEGAVSTSSTVCSGTITTDVYNTLTIRLRGQEICPGLCEALLGLNINILSLSGGWGGLWVNDAKMLSRSLSSLTKLNELSIVLENDSPGLWEALCGLNVKRLCLSGLWRVFRVNYKDLLSQSLLSLTQLDTLSISVFVESPGIFDALHGLNIKSLSLYCLVEVSEANIAESLSHSLSSLSWLERLSIDVYQCRHGLWDALKGLPIKSLRLFSEFTGHEEALSRSLSSLTHLETLCISVSEDSPGLWMALYGLNIKNLSLGEVLNVLKVNHEESLSQSLSSLKQLEKLSIRISEDGPGLWKALHGLNIKSLSICGELGGLKVNHEQSLSQSLTSIPYLETLYIEVQNDSIGLWETLCGLNIKSLCLSSWIFGLKVKHARSLSQSLSSLKQLETLTLHVHTYVSLQLPQTLRYLNIFCDKLLQSELRELVDTLCTCTQTVDIKIEFGCDLFDGPPLQNYIPILQELVAQKNVAVKRFGMYNRTLDIGGVDYNAHDDLSVHDDTSLYKRFLQCMYFTGH
ncbi:hypothetical protein DPMN_072736 [Dreissena polymorpha]|uniref:Uncharacterized protein n=1 Tax=Dreissena polymorpha TaxID=45954 RepID=A0A9D4BXU1_DREPO|nr:hypothetical protein DPMN_072736 [Dreissena polymorpha]